MVWFQRRMPRTPPEAREATRRAPTVKRIARPPLEISSTSSSSRAARAAVRVLDAFGKDIVIVESVGVGQTELDVMNVADTVVVAMVPEGGDAVQVLKAGLMEIADIFVVNKADRRMYLLHHTKVLRDFDIGLGFAPVGHKQIEGDGRTPEGTYTIDRRNPNSRFHLSIGLDYPNERDKAMAEALGKSPGGDIFIHGRPKPYRSNLRDWTWGCIAVTDREIEDIYAMVRDGTPITINP